MPRQSITFTGPNAVWLRQKIEIEGEYKSNSELVNDLIRQQRKSERAGIEAIRTALIEGEKSGLSERTPDEIMRAVIERKQRNGQI